MIFEHVRPEDLGNGADSTRRRAYAVCVLHSTPGMIRPSWSRIVYRAMSLAVGVRLGPYEILAPVGKGGMGEVYKARDTRLGRLVAIKTLKEQFSARFDREARIIAALNHPHICTLHDIGPDYLVMEYIEGTPLKGPLPFRQALEYAVQICDALDAAHRKGIVHRDLKPSNILVTKSGIKLLDFGLAKIAEKLKPKSDSTLSMALTGDNEIAGTLYYMAPEQFPGRSNRQEIDSRTDIFSFGLVLYETLTGKLPFDGAFPAGLNAAVIERPSLAAAVAPAALDHVLQRCLKNDQDDRWQTARDLKAELEWIASAPGEDTTSSLRPQEPRALWVWITAAVCAAIATASFLWAPWRAAPEPSTPVRFQITPPPEVDVGPFSVSPDGTKLAYIGASVDGVTRLWIRTMDAVETHALAGTEHISSAFFWSADSRFITFGSGKLQKVDVAGGPPQPLCDVTIAVGGSWNSDGVILFGTVDGTGIHRVSSAGGTSNRVTALNPARKDMQHVFPAFLPDGKHFLYLVQSAIPQNNGVYLGSLEGKPGDQESKPLVTADFGPCFVPFPGGKQGAILFQRGGTLLAQRFDLRRLEVAGEAVPVADQLGSSGSFAASQNGVLVFRTANSVNKQLAWFDRQGKRVSSAGAPHAYAFMMRLSPDGTRVAVARGDTGAQDIWLIAFSSGIETRFTFDPGMDFDPAWSPDGKYIAFSSNRAGNSDLYRHASDGSGEDELLFQSDHRKVVTDWSRDGRSLLFHDTDPKTKRDLWVLPMDGAPAERKPVSVLRSEFDERDARFSPDGRWIAYMSDESGRNEIYVRSFPAGIGGKWMISQGGGLLAAWRGDSKELFYISSDGTIMAVPISATGAGFQHGLPVALFKGPVTPMGWDVSADGKKFLLAMPIPEAKQAPFTVVLNWLKLWKVG